MRSPEEWQKYIEESQRQRGEPLQQMLQTVGAMPADVACKDQRSELLEQLIQAAAVIQANKDRRNEVCSQPSDTDG